MAIIPVYNIDAEHNVKQIDAIALQNVELISK
jgi:hypothetical protein